MSIPNKGGGTTTWFSFSHQIFPSHSFHSFVVFIQGDEATILQEQGEKVSAKDSKDNIGFFSATH